MDQDCDVQFHNNEAVVNENVAYRMSRRNQMDYVWEQKKFPYNPSSWNEERRMVWFCNLSSANGYGMVAENTIKNLLELGIDVRNPASISGSVASGGEYVDQNVREALDKPIVPDCLEIQHCQPPMLKYDIVERIWTYTMYETTHTPKKWIDMLNKVERVIVPSSWLVESWKEQGLKRPIDVVGHGIDPDVYYYMDRPEKEVFTFIHYGRLSTRKGTDLVYRAFKELFYGRDDVQLILKDTLPFCPVKLDIPNMHFISATYSKEEMREFLKNADCMLFPTRGEGFGLPALEAMATGLPTIVTNWGGTADYIDKKDTLALDYKLERSHEFDIIYKEFYDSTENSGYWAEPSLEDLKGKMKWVVENRDKAMEMGREAAERLAKEWTWKKKIEGLVEIIDNNL